MLLLLRLLSLRRYVSSIYMYATVVYVVLMLYYVYVIVIYDGMYVRNYAASGRPQTHQLR